MNKRKIFNKYNEIDTRINRGTALINIIEFWTINPMQLFAQVASLKIILWQYGIPVWAIFIAIIGKDYLMKLINYIIGKFDEKKFGLWKAQNEYIQKKEHLAPFNQELRDTLEEICKKLEIKSKFEKL